jgi:hypothetical protein
VRLEGLGQLKNPMTSSGIEPAAFRHIITESHHFERYISYIKTRENIRTSRGYFIKEAALNELNSVGFEVLTAVVMKSTVFWDIMQCSPLKVN